MRNTEPYSGLGSEHGRRVLSLFKCAIKMRPNWMTPTVFKDACCFTLGSNFETKLPWVRTYSTRLNYPNPFSSLSAEAEAWEGYL